MVELGSTTVQIYGQEYTIRGEDDPDYVRRVAAFVDERMREVSTSTHQVSSLRVAILAALNIADELLRAGGQGGSVERLQRRALELAEALEEGLASEAAAGAAHEDGKGGDALPDA